MTTSRNLEILVLLNNAINSNVEGDPAYVDMESIRMQTNKLPESVANQFALDLKMRADCFDVIVVNNTVYWMEKVPVISLTVAI